MRILLANLRHLYQRRGLWLAYAGLTVVAWSMVQWVLPTPTKGRGVFGGFLVCSFLWGLLVATTQMETSSRPLSFCLPGHRETVRRLVFLVGLIVSLAFLLILAVLLELPSFIGPWELYSMAPGQTILVAGSYFCASMTAYLLGAGLAFSVVHGGSAVGLMTLVVAACAMFDVFPTIQYPILYWPVGVIALASIVGLASWWWLGRRTWSRLCCDRPRMGLFDPWDRKQVQRYRDFYATRFTKTTPRLDRFFQGRISNRRSSDLGKCVWGALYTTCALIAPQWKAPLTVVVMMVVSAAYVPPAAPTLIGVISFMMVGFILTPIRRTLLVTGGRKERFFATITLLLVLSAFSVLLVGALVGLTHWLAPLVPAVIVKGVMVHPHPIGFKVLLILLALFPITSLLWTLFYERPAWGPVSGSLLFSIMMLSFIQLEWHRMITPGLVLSGTVLSWAVCVPLLYRIAMQSDLGRK